MYGLLLRSVQAYLRSTFGHEVWTRILLAADQPPEGFEPMLPFDSGVLHGILAAASAELDRPAEAILEDVGTFLVADPAHQSVRRLLRFGGTTYSDFLHSLEELPERARLAMPGLELPPMQLDETSPGLFHLTFCCSVPELGPVILGILRTMADDYGALVVIGIGQDEFGSGHGSRLSLQVLETAHGAGRSFQLANSEALDGW